MRTQALEFAEILQKLCQKEFITGFPSVRIYRKGSDKIVKNSLIAHEAYHGDRTADALQTFIDSLVGTADKDSGQARLPYTRRLTLAEGCQVRLLPLSCSGVAWPVITVHPACL